MTNNEEPDSYDADLMAAATDLAAAIRALTATAVVTLADATAFRAATELVSSAAEQISGQRRPLAQLPALDDPVTGRRVFNPVTGFANPLAPPLRVRRAPDGDGVIAEATLEAAYEGPPTVLHGGMSALFLDQLLGTAASAAGLWGMTARLEMDYRAPVPLETPLVFRARVTGHEGRKAEIAGTIATAARPEQILVQARGVFVRPRPEQARAYFQAITDASGSPTPLARPSDATAVLESD